MSAQKNKLTEKHFRGISASPGIAMGPVHLLDKNSISVAKRTLSPEEIPGEIQKFREALQKTKEEILNIKKHVRDNIGEENAKLFDAHLLILEDESVIDEVIRRIREERINADWIYFKIMRNTHDLMVSGKDNYLQERSLDILDVERRVIRNFQEGTDASGPDLPRPVVVVSHQLTPSEIVLLNRKHILGLAIDLGGKTSHMAILARSFEKPAVVGLQYFSKAVEEGNIIIVDGNAGQVILNPTANTLQDYQKRQEDYQKFLEELLPLREQSPTTLDGHEIELSANIEFPEEVESVLSHGAKGVGLYRTEYLFLRKAKFPDEEEQFSEYSGLEEAKNELRERQQPFDNKLPLGIMIEVPAAAMMAEDFAREVDFMSIGTNDLIQYTLAVDRGNEKIAPLYTGFHPAVLRLICKTIGGGHRQKVWVGMCGEFASNPLAIPILLGMGIDELSVTPYFLDETKKNVRSLRYREMKKMAQKVLTYDSAEKIQAYAERFLKRRLPKGLLGMRK